jgi:hypothetical protein
MLWIQQISLLAAFAGAFGLVSPQITENKVSNHVENILAPPPLFRCGGKGGANVKCTIERKMGKKKTPITHFFTTKSISANIFELRVEAVLNGASVLVYSSKIYTTDLRSEGKYVVQVQAATKKDYSWTISTTDALKATYDLKKKDITFEPMGKMSSYLDTSHGVPAASLKSSTTPPNFDVDNVVKAISAYFIMDYHKAIQAATTNKFPQ